MADDINRIIIDSSFLEGTDAKLGVPIHITTQGINYLGYRNVFADVNIGNSVEAFLDRLVSLNIKEPSYGCLASLLDLTLQDFLLKYTDREVKYSTGEGLISGSLSVYVAYKLPILFAPAERSIVVQNTGGRELFKYSSVPASLYVLEREYSKKNILLNYTNYTGYDDFYAVPLPAWDEYLNFETNYTAGSGTLGDWDRYVEIFFAGWVPNNFYGEAYCSECKISGLYSDIELIAGIKTGITAICNASLLKQDSMCLDSYCSLLVHEAIISDITLISGSKQGISLDLYSSYENFTGYLGVEVSMFPIYFDNYSLDIGKYISVSGLICVDAHGAFYNLVASGTYLKINDEKVDVTLDVLEDGYRVCYAPDDYFYSLSGIVKFTAHAENDNGDVLEEEFYLTFGYIVEFDNKDKIGLDYGFGNKVSVRVEAENLSSCPTVINEGYWFVSEEHISRDISAFIIGEPDIQKGNNNLYASIYPHSTAFFYDKDIKVVIKAKDFAGNEMKPFELNFKIKNNS